MENRKGKEVPSGDDIGGVTSNLRAQLQQFGSYATMVNTQLKDVNQLHSELEDGKPLPIVKPRLDRAYDEVERSAKEEIEMLDRAIETLDRLYAMQAAEESAPAPVEPPPAPIAPVVLGGSKRGPYKKKVRGDGSASAAGSPTPSAAPSPAPRHSPSGSAVPLPISSSSKSLPGPVFAPAPPQAAGATTTGARKRSKHERKELLNQQLPLMPGRRVAFHQITVAADGTKEDRWILAQITACIGGDKTKYQVQDLEYDPVATPTVGIFTTTIKSIIPLPGKHDKYIHPLGAAVMALYPDTDSFYRAVIVSGPEIEKGKKKERAYNLRFDDDEGAIRRIPVEMVVELP